MISEEKGRALEKLRDIEHREDEVKLRMRINSVKDLPRQKSQFT